MIQFTGIDTREYNPYSTNKRQTVQNNKKAQLKTFQATKNQKIGVAEGTELFLGGVIKQGKEMVTAIIQHPLKTLAFMAVTSVGLLALPLIGIPSAVGGGVLAIGFAGFAITKAVKHATQFARTNREGTYDQARLHLQQIGEDTFDIALSAPFVPKAISNIKSFIKYGKIGVNSVLINEVNNTKGALKKLKTIAKADAEMSRNFNFQNAVDKEISALKDLTDAQKAQIKQELLEFNVAVENIPELVLDKYAQAKGVQTKPDLAYTTMAKTTHGMAVANNCKIYLNDYKPYRGPKPFDEYVPIKHELKGSEYFITYKNKTTGAVIVETIDATLLDSYNKLCQLYRKLSPEAAKILTILHEREHIHQWAQVCAVKGFDWLKGELKPRGRELFEQMVAEMPKNWNGKEITRIFSYTEPAANGTVAAYIKRPLEIGAREIEIAALNHPSFIPLDNVFKTMKYSKALSIGENILINDARIESAKV